MIKKLNQLKNHQGFMKYFKNTSWLFGEKILRMIVGLFVGIWVARYLGPEQFGLFSYAQSFVGLFVAIAGLGLDGIIVRELVKDESKRDALLGTAFRLKLIGALLVLIALAIAVNLSQQDSLTTLLIFTIASATVFQSFNIIDFYFQAKVLSKYIVYANIISLLISNMVKVGLILNDAPLLYFAYSILFDSFILICGFLYFYRYKALFLSRWYFDKKLARSLLKDSWPMILSGLVISVYMKIDQIMIKEMMNVEAVGFYSVAVKLTEIWLFITVAITSSIFPSIIKAKNISVDLYENRILNLYRVLFFISFVIAVFLSFFSEEIVMVLFGNSFYPSVQILVVYAWSNIFVFMNNASWKWYQIENLQKIAMIRLTLGALINVILNVFFIKFYGLVGAAYATIISYSIAVYFGNLIDKRTLINFKLLTRAVFSFYKIEVRN